MCEFYAVETDKLRTTYFGNFFFDWFPAVLMV